MNETQRQAYLQVMGIQPYFPRVPVPGAKPSPLYAIEVATEIAPIARTTPDKHAPVAANRTPPAARPKTAPIQAAALNIAAAAASSVPKSSTQAPATSALHAASPSPAGPGLRFCLNYYRISSTFAVIDEVPFDHTHRVSDSVLLLLRAILQALGVNSEAIEFKPEPFNWPLETSIDVQVDPALAAQQALLGYMAMRQQRDSFQHLLVFAAQLSTLLPEDRQIQGENNVGDNQTEPAGPYSITVTHSLQSLLAHPILKRETWAHLQALRQRLATPGT